MSRVIVGAAFLCALFAAPCAASTIAWEYDLLVHGSALIPPPPGSPPATPPTVLAVPSGTPMVVDVLFDTNTPNFCGSNPFSGVYTIGAGTPNTATVDFLGFRYSATGGIEMNFAFGICGSGPGGAINDGGVRLFVGAALQQLDPHPTPIEWIGSNGNLFLFIPPSDWLGAAFPSGLNPQPTRFGGNNFLFDSSPALVIESTDLHPLPEPESWMLVASGAGIAGLWRRRRNRDKCYQH